MRKLDLNKTHTYLSRIMEFELAGVVRYTHYSLMVAGPNRIPIVQFMKGQAVESLTHAQQAGEILTGLGGHPTLRIAEIAESNRHSVRDILRESLAHEERALDLYRKLLDEVEDRSVYLEEFARTMIGQEELHSLELRKMLRDLGDSDWPTHSAHDLSPGAKAAQDDAPPAAAPPDEKDKKQRKKDKKQRKQDKRERKKKAEKKGDEPLSAKKDKRKKKDKKKDNELLPAKKDKKKDKGGKKRAE